jgi:hypothetical protein
MKQVLFALLCLIICSATTCKKDGANCHKTIYVRNNSSDTVILARKAYQNSFCKLDGSKQPPGQEFSISNRDCWEDDLANGETQELFIVDLAKFNVPYIFYDCDSIEIKNKILGHYKLTIDSLRKYNFIINYP